MEYVEKLTLREAIDDGISEVDAWRLMVSQRLQELVYALC